MGLEPISSFKHTLSKRADYQLSHLSKILILFLVRPGGIEPLSQPSEGYTLSVKLRAQETLLLYRKLKLAPSRKRFFSLFGS